MLKWFKSLFEKKEKKARPGRPAAWTTDKTGGWTPPPSYYDGRSSDPFQAVVVPVVMNPYSDLNPITNPAPTYDSSPSSVEHDNYPTAGTREHTGFMTGGGFGGETTEFHVGGHIADTPAPADHSFVSESSSDSSSSYSSDYSSSDSSSSYSDSGSSGGGTD